MSVCWIEWLLKFMWGSGGGEDKVDAKLVKDLLEENGYTDLPFSAGDLLRYWDKGPVYSRKKRK